MVSAAHLVLPGVCTLLPVPAGERHTCLKCDLYATQLAAQREELEATITDLRYEVRDFFL